MDLTSLQQQIASYNKQNELQIDPRSRLLDLYSEIGELSKEMLKNSDYGKKEPDLRESWDEELADCLYALLSLANETGVDLEKQITNVMEKYEKRIDKTGAAGSGH